MVKLPVAYLGLLVTGGTTEICSCVARETRFRTISFSIEWCCCCSFWN